MTNKRNRIAAHEPAVLTHPKAPLSRTEQSVWMHPECASAIRRAAEVARRIERDTTWDGVDDGLGDLITAAGIREAIRAALKA